MKALRRLVPMLAVGAVLLATASAAGASAAPKGVFGHATCRSGNVPSGTYQSLRIVGVCKIPNNRTITIRGNLVLAEHAILDSIHMGTVHVNHDVVVNAGAVLGFGCAPSAGCPGTSDDVIGGNLRATGAAAIIMHGNTIRHNINIQGGGGSMDCASTGLFGGPFFFTQEDSTIGGSVWITGLHSCWMGFIRNHVGGSVHVWKNRFGDPDANEIVTNVIAGDLACFNNIPKAQVGDSEGESNVVGGEKRGECAGV
jgi:hypothetical protein